MEMESNQAKLEKVANSDEENERSRDDNATIWKTQLVNDLKCLIELNRALKLIDLLINAQKKHECLAEENRKDGHDCKILCDIQNLLLKEPIDKMVELIFMALKSDRWDEFPTKLQELKSLLMSFPEEDCRKHVEYLDLLTENLEGLVCFFTSLDLKDRKENLELLRQLLIRLGISVVNRVCRLMFDLSINKINLSLEREQILNLMLQAMPYIGDIFLAYICWQHTIKTLIRCQKRSALEFIRELFPTCSEKSIIFKDLLGILNEAIKHLDDISAIHDTTRLKDFDFEFSDDDEFSEAPDDKFSEKPDDECGDASNTETINVDDDRVTDDNCYDIFGDYYEQETLDDFIEAGGNKVPKEHTWWQAYRQAHIH